MTASSTRNNTHSFLLASRARLLPLLLVGVVVAAGIVLWGPYARNASQRHVAEGLQAARSKDYSRAAREFELATTLEPDNADAFYNLGLAYVELGRDREAVDAYSRAAELRPNEFAIHNNLGTAYNHVGDRKRAMQEWETALRLNPRAVPPRVNLALAYEQMEQTDLALRYLGEAAELAPNDPGVRHNLAALYFKLGDLEKAKAELERANQGEPRRRKR